MNQVRELSLNAQTSYAQLLAAALATAHLRSIADLPGSFASKTVKAHKYWYYQYTEPSGKLRQAYVGPDNDAVKRLMGRRDRPAASSALAPLTRSAIALGCAEVPHRHLVVLRRLAEYGFFQAGGLLIGTHAFLAFGNMLGVIWDDASRTQDIDFAYAGKSLALLLPSDGEVRTDNAIESLNMGFLPVTGLSQQAGATWLNPREPEFRLDFLTTLHRGGETAYEHPQLHMTLQPLKFMEFSLEQVQHAVLMSGDRAVLVNLPHPARFALQKLIVFGKRSGAFQTEVNKDLLQAGMLLTVLKERRKSEVVEVWKDLRSRGSGWTSRANKGLVALDKAFPEMKVRSWLKA